MIYDNYKNQMTQKFGAFKKIWRFRFFIVGGAILILAIIVVLLLTSGAIYGESFSTQLTYGDNADFKAKAFLCQVSFEFSDGENTSENMPVEVGEYTVRAVSRNVFGMVKVGKAHSFTIKPAHIEITADDVVYGNEPIIGTALKYEDMFADVKLSYEYSPETEINISDLKIVNAEGDDVSYCYDYALRPIKIKTLPRKIEIKTGDAEKQYDGQPLLCEQYEISSGSLVSGDRIEAKFPSVTDACEAENVPFVSIFGYSEVTDLYDITIVPGTLKVAKRQLYIEIGGAEKVYDGTPLYNDKFSVKDGLLSGHICKLTDYTKPVNAGTYKNEPVFAVFDGDEEVTDNYEFVYNTAYLTILRRPISFRALSKKFGYDGKDHTWGFVELADGSLAAGDRVDVKKSTVAREVGKYANNVELDILNESDEDVTESYEIIVFDGTLVINEAIVIRVLTRKKVYDGTPLSYGANDWFIESNVNELNVEFKLEGARTEVGVLPLSELEKLPVKITDKDGNDVTDENHVEFKGEPLEIVKRKITVSTGSKTLYNSFATCSSDEWWISFGSLADGQDAQVQLMGLQMGVGVSENVVGSIRIYDDKGNDVTGNYEISYIFGILQVI